MRGRLTDPSPPWAFPLLTCGLQGSCFAPWTSSTSPQPTATSPKPPAASSPSSPSLLAWSSLLPSQCLLLLSLSPSFHPSYFSPPLPALSLVFQTIPALQNRASQWLVRSRGRKAFLACGEGQLFQSLLSSQIPYSRAKGSWKDRSRKWTGTMSSIMCQQYAGCYASWNSQSSRVWRLSIITHVFQRKKLRIQEVIELAQLYSWKWGSQHSGSRPARVQSLCSLASLQPHLPAEVMETSPSPYLGMFTPFFKCPRVSRIC